LRTTERSEGVSEERSDEGFDLAVGNVSRARGVA